MSNEKFQFPTYVPKIGAVIRVTGTRPNENGDFELYIEEAVVTSRLCQIIPKSGFARYRFNTNGVAFCVIHAAHNRGEYFWPVPDSKIGGTLSVSVEILPTKPAEES